MPVRSSASNLCRCCKATPRRRSLRAFWRSSTESILKLCVWWPRPDKVHSAEAQIKNPRRGTGGYERPSQAGLGSCNFQIFRRGSAAVGNKFVLDRLALVERAQASALDG